MKIKMKYKVGDRVRVKSLEWYEKNKDANGDIIGVLEFVFLKGMEEYCGKELKIIGVYDCHYLTDSNNYIWQDWMFEDEPVTEEKQEVEQLNQNNMETKKITLKEAQEIVKNTKYIVFTEEESIKLQKKLFEIGCKRIGAKQEVRNTEFPFLFVDKNLEITFAEKETYGWFESSINNYVQSDNIISIEIEQPKEEQKPKFDPNTLQPFDKVLVRQNEESIWIARFFEFYENCSCGSYHTTSGSTWKYCIPFNDDTKHLHRTCENL